ncbi:MAG: hypothetical protein ABIQ86_16035 [Steroidobacteraceae bacterium]
MNPSDEERDALTEAYRKASAKDAGGPGTATRNAILAEAAAEVRRRTPAANDSRYLWRGVAAVAVVGFGLLLWRQVDQQKPGESYVVAKIFVEPEHEVKFDLPVPVDPAGRVSVAANSATDSAAGAGSQILDDQPAASRASAPAKAEAAAELSAAPALRERNDSGRAEAKMSATQDAEADADALLRLHFPAVYQSDTPHTVWLVQDATGAVLRSGELPAGRNLADVRSDLERGPGGRLLRPWRIHSLRNARGQPVELAVSQTP